MAHGKALDMKSRFRFADRRAAGAELAQKIAAMTAAEPIVLALPRGGVPVAVEIARTLGAPLELVFVRKIGHPTQRELAVAAVVDGGDAEVVVNDDVVRRAKLPPGYIAEQTNIELAEIDRRRRVYLGNRSHIALEGRTLILVDDGVATGASVRAAMAALRRKSPKRLILAVPVAARETLAALRRELDDVVCLTVPEPFLAVGESYRDFHDLTDDEVIASMRELQAVE
jgi:putative phosphoribosyl transferase